MSAYDQGYDDCLAYNGDDAEEYNPYDVDSPEWMAYYSGWARGQEVLTEGYDDCDIDGDWDTGMASAGWGTDEDYGYYGDEDW